MPVLKNFMKITFLLPHLKPSGGVNADITFAYKLSKRGHQVFVAVRVPGIFRNFVKHPLTHIKTLLNMHSLIPNDSKVKLMMVESFDEIPESDIYFADSWEMASELYKLKRDGLKFQYIQHDERMYHGNPEEVDKVFRLPMKKIVDATWLAKIFKDEYGYDADLLFNAIDYDNFYPSKIPKSDNDIRIMLLHHNFAWKGTKEGVEVVNKLKEKYKNVKLILFGTRERKIEYICDEYHFNVFNEKLADLFRSIDIYVCPSWDEGLCFPPRWAMASGKALVTYDNGSSQDYAFDGDTALVARKKDKEDLYKKIEMLIANPELRSKIAKRGLEYVRSMPNWDQLTDKLENILKGELSKHAKN